MTESAASQKSGGAQAVDRALGLLRLVAEAPQEGLRLADVAAASGLDRATCHRLLASLVNHGLIEQDASNKRYTLGLALFSLAAAASNRFDVGAISRTVLQALSDETGETATLCLRSGAMLVCMDVELGGFPIKALPMDIGSHRPLGAGAAGTAILAALPDFEVEQVLAKTAQRRAGMPGQDRDTIDPAVAACRAAGHALVAEPPPGQVMGLAVALVNRLGRPQGALALHGIAERFPPERVAELVARITERARSIDDAMARIPDDERHRGRWLSARVAEGGGGKR